MEKCRGSISDVTGESTRAECEGFTQRTLKQDYIIQCLLKHEIRVVGGMKVAKKVQVHLDTILEELQTLDEADIMSKTTFEKLGIPYEERDGIFYPVLVAGTEQTDIKAGKYGRMWIKYIKEEYPMRYKSLVRFGELEESANEVNEAAYELLDDIEAKWLKKHKPENPNSFMEQLQLRTQTRMMAEEIVIMDVVMQFH